MASQGLGQFAGSFADALTRTLGQAQDRKDKEELAKQRAKFVDLQMRALGDKLDAQTTMSEILTGSIEEFVPAEPKLTEQGREIPNFTNASREPQNLIEALTQNPEFQSAAIQSGNLNIGDLLDFQSAQNQLSAFNQAGDGGSSGRTDAAGNSEFIPGPPSTQIGSDGKVVINRPQVPNPAFRSPIAAATGAQEIEHAITQVDNAMEVMASLEGTILQTGSPLGDVAGIFQSGAAAVGAADFLGIDKTAVQRRQRAKKLLADNLLSSEQLKILQKQGSVTDAKLAAVTAASADLENGMLANGLQMLDALEIKVKNAEILGIPMSDPGSVLQQIEERRAKLTEQLFGNPQSGSFLDTAQEKFNQAQQKTSAVAIQARQQVSAIAKMSLGRLQQLQQSGAELSKEAIAEIDKRWKELAPSRKMLAMKAAMEIASARESLSKQISVIKTFDLEALKQLGDSGLKIAEEVRAEAERRWDELNGGS